MQKCSVCIHPQKDEINYALLRAVMPLRDIADQFSLSKSSLLRHRDNHIPRDLVQSKRANEICNADNLLNTLISLKRDAERITKKAEETDDLKTALAGIREGVRIIEILAKMRGKIQQPQVTLTVNNVSLSKIYDRLSKKMESDNEING